MLYGYLPKEIASTSKHQAAASLRAAAPMAIEPEITVNSQINR